MEEFVVKSELDPCPHVVRRRCNSRFVGALASLFILLGSWVLPGGAEMLGAADVTGAIKSSIDRGCGFLAGDQNPDGGYGPYGVENVRVPNVSDVGITAFALYALAKNPRKYVEADGPAISGAAEFLLSKQQDDGAFYDRRDPSLKTYKTSVALLALSALNAAKYAASIRRGQEFIRAQQATVERGYDQEKHLSFGAVGYGDNLRMSLSVTEFAAEAMHETGVSGSDEFWAPLVVYVSRCRNAETVGPVLEELGIGTTGDLGFRYAPNDTRGPEETLDEGVRVFSSYGTMTYAALKTLLYARLSKDDPLLKDTMTWVARNYTVRENPGMATEANPKSGLDGLFYYFHAMAKALSAYGQRTITDEKGIRHDWAVELSQHILALQQEDGSWSNESFRWYEGLPTIATSYAVVSLAECYEFLRSPAARGEVGADPGGSRVGPKPAGNEAAPGK